MTTHLRCRPLASLVAVAGLALVAGLLPTASASPSSSLAGPARAGGDLPLTNLDHLDFLGDTVTPPDQPRHTTFRLEQEPSIGVLWTYADRQPDGSYRRVGGGDYDAATDTYGQGAFNADDLTRAAVVYLRHWRQTGDTSSRDAARELLRGVTYLQTASGPNAGNVVLWMQPDGTLNRSAEPVELPDPSDSAESYWLARTIWALGEGYAAFQGRDPAFARFLARRLDLAIEAVDRQVLDRYGEYVRVDGLRTPAWLIVDGADASAEAMLGLAAYVEAGGPRPARVALRRLGKGVAQLSGGDAQRWPFGGIRPWAISRSVYHSWASLMPAALGETRQAFPEPRHTRALLRDSFTFDPWLLTSGGTDNGRLPTRTDTVQIAYGTDSRLQSLLATAEATGRSAGALGLAGMVAAWYFGANASGDPMYDPATGRTYDGVDGEGEINLNSGAESTIHGLLSMLALDERPRVARQARTATIHRRDGDITLQAEDGELSGDAAVVEPAELWTGESLYGGTGYVAAGEGGQVTYPLPQHDESLLLAVHELRPGNNAVTSYATPRTELGEVSNDVARKGASPAPGALLPVTLDRVVGAGANRVRAVSDAGSEPSRLDALVLRPLVSRLVLHGNGTPTALLSSASDDVERTRVYLPGQGPVSIRTFTGLGRPVEDRVVEDTDAVQVRVPAGGFAIVRGENP